MNIQHHALFPVLVTESFYEKKDEFKNKFNSQIMKYISPEGFSNERTGHVFMHHEIEFYDLFNFITKIAKSYLQQLNIDSEIFDFNIVKSWMNIIRNRGTPLHFHGDAHLSFSYYVNVPDDAAFPIIFHNQLVNRMEPFPGIIEWNCDGNWTWLNSYTWKFIPKEGQLFVFPAKLFHETPETFFDPDYPVKNVNDLKSKRVSIAGDIILTYKERTAKCLGLQPIHNWKTFD